MQKLIAIARSAFLYAAPGFVAASEILNVAVPASDRRAAGRLMEQTPAVNYLLAGEIRIIARANDSPPCKAGARASCLTLFVNGDPISSQIEQLLGEVCKVGCPSLS